MWESRPGAFDLRQVIISHICGDFHTALDRGMGRVSRRICNFRDATDQKYATS